MINPSAVGPDTNPDIHAVIGKMHADLESLPGGNYKVFYAIYQPVGYAGRGDGGRSSGYYGFTSKGLHIVVYFVGKAYDLANPPERWQKETIPVENIKKIVVTSLRIDVYLKKDMAIRNFDVAGWTLRPKKIKSIDRFFIDTLFHSKYKGAEDSTDNQEWHTPMDKKRLKEFCELNAIEYKGVGVTPWAVIFWFIVVAVVVAFLLIVYLSWYFKQ